MRKEMEILQSIRFLGYLKRHNADRQLLDGNLIELSWQL